jgi:hypothetical protein
MAKTEPIQTTANDLATVSSHIVEILTPFSLEDRRKILNAMLLGTPSVPQVAPKNSPPPGRRKTVDTLEEMIRTAGTYASYSTPRIA